MTVFETMLFETMLYNVMDRRNKKNVVNNLYIEKAVKLITIVARKHRRSKFPILNPDFQFLGVRTPMIVATIVNSLRGVYLL